MDLSLLSTPSPDFSRALDIRFPSPASSETPDAIREGVARIRQIRDRKEKLDFALRVLHEMLYLAECPEDFLSIAKLIADVRHESAESGG
jgi:hypothetical protein